jgi:hydroxymethylpyrimidine pyrophosphatase-like HAD family hydrolase
MSTNRPLVLVDLDDTLFQTARKMNSEPRHTATLDVNGNPNGYMSDVQKFFIDWLLVSADVVPVTARSVEAYQRVNLPFAHGAICAHGGVILQSDGLLDSDWHAKMTEVLISYQERLYTLSEQTLEIGNELGFSLRGWVVEEAGLANYVVTKHNEASDEVLVTVLAEMEGRGLLDDLYVHGNGNNLAFIPTPLSKRNAVQEWIRRDIALNGDRPVLGFGDSVSDLGFLDECHWWGTPKNSQLDAFVRKKLI